MYEYFINDLIEMKDPNVIITKSFTERGIKHIYIEVRKSTHTCPRCGKETSRVHDYRVRKIKHFISHSYEIRKKHIVPLRADLPEVLSIDEFKNLSKVTVSMHS